MPSLADWKPYTHHIQGGLREGNFISSQFAIICAGPPFLRNLSSAGSALGVDTQKLTTGMAVYPIGIVQQMSLSQSKNIARFFEVGSDRAYFIAGRTIGQMSMSRVLYHGPNILRALYAYYDTTDGAPAAGEYQVRPLFDRSLSAAASPFGVPPFSDSSLGQPTASGSSHLHRIKIPPGYDNFFMNLASDLFSQPMGLLFILKDNEETTYGAFYLEQAYVPNTQFGFESQGLMVSEGVSIQYERLVPIRMSQLGLVRDIGGTSTGGFLADDFGGYGSPGSLI